MLDCEAVSFIRKCTRIAPLINLASKPGKVACMTPEPELKNIPEPISPPIEANTELTKRVAKALVISN